MYFSTSSLNSRSIWGVSLSPQFKTEIRFSSTICLPLLQLNGGSDPDLPQPPKQFKVSSFLQILLFNIGKVSSFLVQYGYEPVSPYTVATRSITDYLMGRPKVSCVYLPGIYGYSKGLVQKFGWSCVLAGVGPGLTIKLIEEIIEMQLAHPIENFLCKKFGYHMQNDNYPFFNMKKIMVVCIQKTIISSVTLFYTYPIIVVENNCILRCIKGEPSVWMWNIFRQVWQEAGIGGIYSGVIPLLLGQITTIWCMEFILEIYRLITHNEVKLLNCLFYYLSSFVVSYLTYPAYLVSGIMSANKSTARLNLEIPQLPVFKSSLACFKHLYNTGIWFRGSSLILRRFICTEL
ncbi:Mitochondrial carrier-like protein 1 [Oopsacas minuta]|uniref:Mitochondrial carrier-like protein 1 n=1 Tax=Oopsacas minuta TaxID=111878 RepID=A0AAV7K3D1_9METZ|nr:Mitochondrial carrier-like protein 1 [Oopsacas minuta]